jgi:hypothetical protein
MPKKAVVFDSAGSPQAAQSRRIDNRASFSDLILDMRITLDGSKVTSDNPQRDFALSGRQCCVVIPSRSASLVAGACLRPWRPVERQPISPHVSREVTP